jgi:hypothetical protein
VALKKPSLSENLYKNNLNMKSKILCLSIFVLLFFQQSYSQSYGFNLSDYKLPELKMKILETSVDLSGQNNYFKLPSITQAGFVKYNYSRFARE